MLAEPKNLAFSEWTPWHERSRLKSNDGLAWMGVYLWAHFKKSPATRRSYPGLPQEVIYVGETNDLDFRLLGTPRHHRLSNYRERFKDDPECKQLYVSILRVAPFQRQDRKCHALRALTRYIEAKIGWEYTKLFDRRPRLDYKRGKDEFALR